MPDAKSDRLVIKKRVRVAVTGAAGQIGYALVFRIASGEMLGPDVQIDLMLIEVPQALSALKGLAMELEDCAFPLLSSLVCTDDIKQGFKDADWCLLVGAMPRKAGMERSDLLKGNAAIFKDQGRAINEVAGPQVKVLVVGNPCNTNACIAKHHAPDIPDNRFFAMTMLDENRAKAQLALKAGVSISEVSNMIVWGNHSSTQFPDFSHALIQGKPATQIITDQKWLQGLFIETVQKRGSAIIEARGLSSSASAANAIIETVACIEGARRPGEHFSVATSSEGFYDTRPGLMISFPSRVKKGILEIAKDWCFDRFSEAGMRRSFDELEDEYKTVLSLGFLDEKK